MSWAGPGAWGVMPVSPAAGSTGWTAGPTSGGCAPVCGSVERPGNNESGLVNVGGGKKPLLVGVATGAGRIVVGAGKAGWGMGLAAARGVTDAAPVGVNGGVTKRTGVRVAVAVLVAIVD